MTGEWHFFGTSRGKGPCDGIEGCIKRLAARASLQRPYDKQILTPHQLYEFACAEIKTINFYYATTEEHNSEAEALQQRFDLARTIAETHGLHSFLPISKDKLEVREFSASPVAREECVSLMQYASIQRPVMRGYVIAVYDGHWWLACVLRSLEESGNSE